MFVYTRDEKVIATSDTELKINNSEVTTTDLTWRVLFENGEIVSWEDSQAKIDYDQDISSSLQSRCMKKLRS